MTWSYSVISTSLVRVAKRQDKIRMKLALLLCIATLISLGQSCQTLPPIPTGPPAPGSSCQCGVRKAKKNNNRIIGGENVARGEFPWQVALVYKWDSTPWCGGTLLSSDTVLTAAHCEEMVEMIDVVVAEHDHRLKDGEQRVSPKKWINHPNYRPLMKLDTGNLPPDNDFAIIKLATPVSFSDYVVPACLPSTRVPVCCWSPCIGAQIPASCMLACYWSMAVCYWAISQSKTTT